MMNAECRIGRTAPDSAFCILHFPRRSRVLIGRQEFPDPGEVTALQSLVHNVGTPEQQRKVAELGAIAEMGAKFKTLPAAQRQAVVSAWLEKGKAGAPQFERTLAASLATADGAISSAYKEDRYGAAYRYSEGVSTLPPIDWSNPNAAASILKAKVAQQNQINADQDLTPGSVLRPGEAAALKTTLTQGLGAAPGLRQDQDLEVIALEVSTEHVVVKR